MDSAEQYTRASVVGSYRIIGLLGTGGMGTVYCAEHVLIGKPAAVKVLLPQYGRDRGIVARFFNEARAVSAIQHPGIVELYDFGYMDDGSAYIVMELLRGETLASRIAGRGRLTEAEALPIVRGIAGALGAVHAKGIVHRDIKPENVFLVPDPEAAAGERVKVLDFGIAKLTDDPGALSQTSTNAMLGTPMYMSPEQCRGAGQVDHRADLYALGCVLFEMLAGVPPFVGEGAGEVIGAHLHVAPPVLSTLVPEISPLSDQIASALLAKRPEDRLQTANDVLQLLNHRIETTSVTSAAQVTIRLTTETAHPAVSTTLGTAAVGVVLPPAPSRSRPHALAGAAVVALAIAAIVLVLGVRRHGERADPAQTPAQALDATRPPPAIAIGVDTAAAPHGAHRAAPDALLPPSDTPESPVAAPPAQHPPTVASPTPDPPITASSVATSSAERPPATSSVPAAPSREPSAEAPGPPQRPPATSSVPASSSREPSAAAPGQSPARPAPRDTERPSKAAPPARPRRSSDPKKSGPKADASSRKAPVVEDL